MTQHNIKIMNYPEPSSEEKFVRSAGQALALARGWSGTVVDSGLEDVLGLADRPQLRAVLEQARRRALLSPDSRDAVLGLADRCSRRASWLAGRCVPATHAQASVLASHETKLRELAAAIDDVLDLEEAVRAWRRIDREAAQPAQAEAPTRGPASSALRPVAFPRTS